MLMRLTMQQRLRYPELAPEGIAALRSLDHYLNAASGLESVLLELIRLRVSQLNGCDFCIASHTAELHKHNEPATRMDAVQHWHPSEAFTERERAALRWAEAITGIQQGHASDDDYAAAHQHFTDAELVNLTLAIASINAWNRMAIAFRPQWQSNAQPHDSQPHRQDATGDDGGKVAVEDESATSTAA